MRREGFRTTRELFDHWIERWGIPDLDQYVLVVSFVKGEREKERYLRATPPRFDPMAEGRAETDGDRGYTSNPSGGVPGRSVDDAELDEYAKQARAKEKARALDEHRDRRHLSPAERLRLVTEESQRLGIDISPETRLIGQRLLRAEDTIDNHSSGTNL